MALTSYDIRWQTYRIDVSDAIFSCGEFLNVPLIGAKGCINFNSVLSLRHFGYILKHKPFEKEVKESVYFEKGVNLVMLRKVRVAWENIHRNDGA